MSPVPSPRSRVESRPAPARAPGPTLVPAKAAGLADSRPPTPRARPFARLPATGAGTLLVGLAGLVGLAWLPPAGAAPPVLVDDLTPTTSETSAFRVFWGDPVGDTALFWAVDDLAGAQLWRTDGSAEGTTLYAEVCPGLCSSDSTPWYFTSETGVFDGERTFFEARDGIHGQELWTSDGTPEGTRMVADLCPGSCDSFPRFFSLEDGDPGERRLFFRLDSGQEGAEPWVSDGTAEGTFALGDLRPGSAGSFPNSFLPFSGGMAFTAYTNDTGFAWWWTDGTPEGTVRSIDACGGGACSPEIGAPVVATLGDDDGAGSLYFVSTFYDDDFLPTSHTLYRWAPNPTAGLAPPDPPEALGVLCVGYCGGQFPTSFVAGDRLYVAIGQQLWSTDGRVMGTRKEFDFSPEISWIHQLVELGNGTRVMIADDQNSDQRLWRLEESGPKGPILGGTSDLSLALLGDQALLLQTEFLQFGVWRSDGTSAGTVQIGSLPSGRSVPTNAGPLTSLGDPSSPDQVIFATQTNGDLFGRELWATRGQAGDLERIVGSSPWGVSSLPRSLVPLRSGLAYLAQNRVPDPSGGERLFVGGIDGDVDLLESSFERPFSIRGVTVGTFPLAIIEAQTPSPGFGDNLWITAGSEQETYLLWPDPNEPLQYLRDPVSAGNHFYFLADQGLGQKIFRSMGIPGSTELLADINPTWLNDPIGCPICSPPLPPGPIYPRYLSVLEREPDTTLAFVARAKETGAELWQSDGTPEGTTLVVDLVPGEAGSDPANFLVVGSRLLFTADDGTGRAWWLWNGKIDAELELERWDRDEAPGAVVASASTRIDGADHVVWFERSGTELTLYLSDGTLARTYPLFSLADDPPSINQVVARSELVAVEGRAYFVLGGEQGGAELFSFPLRQTGVVTPPPRPERVVDLWPGPNGSYPEQLQVLAGKVFFTADDGISGRELWRLDPESPTLDVDLVFDLAPGPASSSPRQIMLGGPSSSGPDGASQVLYFTADDGTTGREVWGFELDSEVCVPDSIHHCLQDGLFRVSSRWRTQDASGNVSEGVGRTLPATRDTGHFWFFDEDNLELATKVLDGRATNGAYWTFYGALSDVEYWIDVEELATGNKKTYYNAPGNLCGGADLNAFPPLFADDLLSDPFPPTSLATGLPSATIEAEARSTELDDETTCSNGIGSACLLDRFAVSVEWRTADAQGIGRRVLDGFSGTDETALFWFFDEDNVELAIKVLDGRVINDRFWIYFGALSDVEYTVRVVDTDTGVAREYSNQEGDLCGQADIDAF